MADQVPTSVKRPASQYYWGDWWKDKGLHSCSLSARGLWHEMNCLMHEGEPYGHLTLNGRPMTIQQLANQCRITASVCKRLVDELLAAGVPSMADSGALYSRRMVRDEGVRNARASGGKEGAEHGIKGASHGSKGGRPSKPEGGEKTPLPHAPKPPPSSSSSASPSENTSPPSGDPSAAAGTHAAPAAPTPPAPTPAPPPKEPRGAKKCPADFQVTPAMVQWAVKEYPNVGEDPDALRRETQAFRDHTFGTARQDWPGAWRNWIKKASELLVSRTRSTGVPQRTTERRETVAKHFPAVAERRGPPPRETLDGEVHDVTPRTPAIPR